MQLTIEAASATELRAKVLELADTYQAVGQQYDEGYRAGLQRARDLHFEYKGGAGKLAIEPAAEEIPAPPAELEEEEMLDTAPPPPAPTKEKRGRGRPPTKAAVAKAAPAPLAVAAVFEEATDPFAAAPAEEEVEEEVPPPPAPAKIAAKTGITVPATDAMEALRQVNSQKGLPVARKVLEQFNCTRISELPAKMHPAFVKACHEAIGA